MRLELQSDLNLAITEATDSTVSSALQAVVGDDCIGTAAENYQVFEQTVRNPEANFAQKVVSSQLSSCLEPKSCNFEPTKRQTETDCIWDATGGFCNVCDGPKCTRVGRPVTCKLMLGTSESTLSSLCATYGGVLWKGECFFVSRLTKSVCLGEKPRNVAIVEVDSSRSQNYCYDPLVTSSSRCTGVWDSTLARCIFTLNLAQCNANAYKFVPSYKFTPGKLHTSTLCTTTNICRDTSITDVTSSSLCQSAAVQTSQLLAPVTSCSDEEYTNINGGLCTFLPSEQLFNCGQFNNTQTGICVSADSRATCVGANKVWVSKSIDQTSCISKGQYCEHPSGSLSLLKGTNCTSCGGVLKNRYTWVDEPTTSNSPLMTTGTWLPVKWGSSNFAERTATMQKIQDLTKKTAAKLLARTTFNDFRGPINTLIAVFKGVACDCVEKQGTCFTEQITTVLRECKIDPTTSSECNGAYFSAPKTNSTVAIEIKATGYSAANYISLNATNITNVNNIGSSNLVKRCNPVANYEVVVGGGQIIGNGVSFTTSSDSFTDVYICLKIDQSIPKNTNKYSTYDFGFVFGTDVYAMSMSLSSDGSQVCATVTKFPDLVYIPIFR